MRSLKQTLAKRLLVILTCIITLSFVSCTPKDWYLGEWQGTWRNKFSHSTDENVTWTLTVNPDNTCHIRIERYGLRYNYDCIWEKVNRKTIKITDPSGLIRVYPEGGSVHVDKMGAYLNSKGRFGMLKDDLDLGLLMTKIDNNE